MNRLKLAVTALLACAVAGFALGQNADKNSAGPTRNDYRLRVVEPAEGATITGSTVHVIVNTEIPAERDTRQNVDSMPRPDVDVFIDQTLKGTMRDENNVLDIENVPPGSHKLVLLAKNRSGEIIDRKEVNIATIATSVATTTTGSTSTTVAERPAPPPPPPPAPAYVPPPAPPPAPAPAYVPPPAPPARELPKTATSDPAVAAAGLALLLGGLALRRLA